MRSDDAQLEAFVLHTLQPAIDVLAEYRSVSTDNMDPEAIHRFRVAIRRLRADLRSLRPFLDRDRVRELRMRLAELDELVRPVRDGDVMMQRLATSAGRIPNPVDPEIIEAIHQRLSDATEAARHRLFAALAAGSQDALIALLLGLPGSGFVHPGSDPVPALRARNAQLWRRVHRAAKALGRDPDDEQLHRVRVLVKRSRYLAEASEPLFGKSASRRARRAGRIQRVLGEHQDSVVLSRTLLAMPCPTSAHAIAIDALLAVESDARVRLRAKWHKLWRRTARRDPCPNAG